MAPAPAWAVIDFQINQNGLNDPRGVTKDVYFSAYQII